MVNNLIECNKNDIELIEQFINLINEKERTCCTSLYSLEVAGLIEENYNVSCFEYISKDKKEMLRVYF